jgi:hypothetical protein
MGSIQLIVIFSGARPRWKHRTVAYQRFQCTGPWKCPYYLAPSRWNGFPTRGYDYQHLRVVVVLLSVAHPGRAIDPIWRRLRVRDRSRGSFSSRMPSADRGLVADRPPSARCDVCRPPPVEGKGETVVLVADALDFEGGAYLDPPDLAGWDGVGVAPGGLRRKHSLNGGLAAMLC